MNNNNKGIIARDITNANLAIGGSTQNIRPEQIKKHLDFGVKFGIMQQL